MTGRKTDELRLRGDRLTWREVDGELVVLDVDRSVYLASNRSGTVLWRALRDGASREQLVDELASTFGLDASEAAADVDRFIGELDRLGLLED